MALMPDQIDDFVSLTLSKFKRNKWTDLSLEHTQYVSSTLNTKKKVREQGGKDISWRIKVKNTGNARNTGMFDQDQTNVDDVMISASIPWAMQTTNFSYDIREDLFQSGPETIIRELEVREHDALSDMAELSEENLWSAPTSSSESRPMGVPFWLQKNVTEPDGGFTGGNPSGWSGGAAGVDSNTYPRWRNWAFKYTTVTSDDLIRKIKKSITNTNFVAPVPHPELGFGKPDWCMYTTYRTLEPMERLAETRNDNLGNDLARYVNNVVVGGVPVKYVPYLEANDTSDPIYGINWGAFRPIVKTGWDMKRHKPKVSARQRNVREVHYDNSCQYACYNRRTCFVGSTA